MLDDKKHYSSIKQWHELIYNVFRGVRVPIDPILSSYDDEGASEVFGNKAVDEVAISDLRQNPDALWFLSPEAINYYLPSIVSAMLNDTETSDVLWGRFIGQFSGRINLERTNTIIALMTPEQRSVIRAFIEHRMLQTFPDAETTQALLNLARKEP